MSKNIILRDLGLKDYKETWDYQEELFKQNTQIKIHNRQNPDNPKHTQNHILFVEHPHTYTLGKSGDMSNLLISEQELLTKKAIFYKINRGGDITYHGPGQLVVYPILDLDFFFNDIHKYLRLLEEVVIKTLHTFDIKSTRSKGETGVWIDAGTPFARKICAMGIRVSRWITMHGLALNINTNQEYFDNIIPCGITDKKVTSMQKELSKKVSVNDVKKQIIKNFAEVFECQISQQID